MKNSKGFTLIELMIVVAVVAILVAIALPNYTEYVNRARRADAKNALLDVQLAQGKWRAVNAAYTDNFASLGLANTSADGHYDIAITGPSATAFTATATPKGKQSGDSCGTFTITQAGPDPTQAACWDK